MKMLIAVSSKHGSTAEIAASIGETIRETGIEVDVVDAKDVESVAPYNAVIVGSAVHLGRWMGPARDLVNGSADALRTRPVWLFSSGPLGEPATPAEEPADAVAIMEATRARDHRVFPGSLWKDELGIAERAMVAAVRAPEGDFRPWAEIDEWAGQIADELTAPV